MLRLNRVRSLKPSRQDYSNTSHVTVKLMSYALVPTHEPIQIHPMLRLNGGQDGVQSEDDSIQIHPMLRLNCLLLRILAI